MKKKIILIVVIVIALILLLPIPMKLKDGGSIEFQALLYTVTKYHKLDESAENGYVDGIGIKILGMEIFNNTKDFETQTETRERRKIKDVKIVNSKVLEANEKTMVLNINNEAVLFEAAVGDKINEISNNDNKEHYSFVGTILEETTTYMIVEPNEDEDERKSADKIRINYGTDNGDYLYGIGRKVIIKYTGTIKETYPAQIDTNEILIDGYEDFELSVKKSDKTTKTKILNNQELYKNNSDFDLYYYGLDEVNIFVDNKEIALKDALKNGKMTIDGILARANQDVSNGKIKSEMYKDGGTTEWYYDTYTIIKCHSLDGNRDVYIGVPEMRLNTIK